MPSKKLNKSMRITSCGGVSCEKLAESITPAFIKKKFAAFTKTIKKAMEQKMISVSSGIRE